MDEEKLSPGSPDGMLAASARKGDLDAFRELYHRYVRHIYDFLLRTLHDPVVARELTQATFLRAHARLTVLRDPDRVREWLFGLAYRLAVGQLRRGPVPVAVNAVPRSVGPRIGGGTATDLAPGDLEGADLVWEAASSLAPDLYAVIDVTARLGIAAAELADDSGLPRAEVMEQLERAHEAFGRSVRELLMHRSGDWCPGLASLLQTTDMASPDDRERIDEHLGHCPRCRPIAERLTSATALSESPLHPLDPLLSRDGWDMLLAEMAKAAPRAIRAALNQPEPPTEDSAQLVASESAMEYFAFPAPGASTLRHETDIMRHASVRRAHDRADRARYRRVAGWAALVVFVAALVVVGIIVHIHHPAPPANLSRPNSSSTTLTTTSHPSTSATGPTTTQRPTTSRPTTTKLTTTTKPTVTTVPVVPVPVLTSMSPTSGFPGATVTLTGTHFVSGDLVDFTGPTLPGGTEELTPTSLSATEIRSAVPDFATFAGQHIVVAVRNASGVVSRSEIFVVEAYWSGTWTHTNARVSLQPSNATYGTTREGQINVFQTDVEGEQCMVDETAPVYLPTSGGPPVAVVPKTNTCPSAEFVVGS